MKTYVYGSYMCVYSCVYASTKRLVCNVSLKEISEGVKDSELTTV